jgi:hypothetical protein
LPRLCWAGAGKRDRQWGRAAHASEAAALGAAGDALVMLAFFRALGAAGDALVMLAFFGALGAGAALIRSDREAAQWSAYRVRGWRPWFRGSQTRSCGPSRGTPTPYNC